ncbi:MAG: MFS transporter [Bifidobacteriaceae bacterium]|jgi:MFS family permease|nr:MFS transporter [Bifidobacteriaceae bacterium]
MMARVLFASYKRVLAIPGVGRVLALGLVARLPHATSGLVFSLHIVNTLHQDFARAGIAVTILTIGLAAGAPWRGRAVDRVGLRRAVLPSVIIEAAAWMALPWISYELLLVASLAIGMFMVPVFPVIRQAIAALVPRGMHQPALALDAVCTELTFVVGPVLAAWMVTGYSSRAALLAIGGATVVVGTLLMIVNPPTHPDPTRHLEDAVDDLAESLPPGLPPADAAPSLPESGAPGLPGSPPDAAADAGLDLPEGTAPDQGAPDQTAPESPPDQSEPDPAQAGKGRFTSAELWWVLTATVATTFALSGWDLGIVAVLKSWDVSTATGLVLAASAVGSAIGGVAYGAAPRAAHPLVMVICMALATAPCAIATTVPTLTVASFVAGLFCAPAMTAVNMSLTRLVPPHRLGEAMGWNGTAMTVGESLGSPLCGFVIDRTAPAGGFLVAAGLAAAVGAVGLLFRRRTRRN